MPEPLPSDVPVNCPHCGAVLAFVRTTDQTQIYRCPVLGLLMLPPDGRMRQVPA